MVFLFSALLFSYTCLVEKKIWVLWGQTLSLIPVGRTLSTVPGMQYELDKIFLE